MNIYIYEEKKLLLDSMENIGISSQNVYNILKKSVEKQFLDLLNLHDLGYDKSDMEILRNNLFTGVNDDENLKALSNLSSDFLKENSSKFIAIVNGSVVDTDPNLEFLLRRVNQNYPNHDHLIHQVGYNVARIRGPRLSLRQP